MGGLRPFFGELGVGDRSYGKNLPFLIQHHVDGYSRLRRHFRLPGVVVKKRVLLALDYQQTGAAAGIAQDLASLLRDFSFQIAENESSFMPARNCAMLLRIVSHDFAPPSPY